MRATLTLYPFIFSSTTTFLQEEKCLMRAGYSIRVREIFGKPLTTSNGSRNTEVPLPLRKRAYQT